MAGRGKVNRTESQKMNPSQLRMACAGLGWGWDDLAKAAGVSRDTIARFLRDEELKPSTVAAIQSALEEAGIEFTNGSAPGVRLLDRKKTGPR
jgi:transcriptional regulator with XRE-family HTH domain